MENPRYYYRYCPRCGMHTPHTAVWYRPFFATCRAACPARRIKAGVIPAAVCGLTHQLVGQYATAVFIGLPMLLWVGLHARVTNPLRERWLRHRARVALQFLNTLNARLVAAGVPRERRRQITRDMLYRHNIDSLKRLSEDGQ